MLCGTRDVLCARKTVADYLTNAAFYLSNDRIHDFHRFGCVPPDPKYHMVLYGGPSKLVANQGAAVLAILSEGPKFTLTYRYDARCGTPHRPRRAPAGHAARDR